MIDFEGMEFKEACAYLNIERPDYRPDQAPSPAKPIFTPTTHQSPAQLWQEKAGKFLTWSQDMLKENKEVMNWLAARGINAQAVEAARLGWNPGENGKDVFRARKAWGLPEIKKENGKPRMLWIPQGLIIPYIVNGVIQRLRIRRPEGELRYYIVPGSSMSTMIIGAERRAFVIIESELDSIACASACPLAGAIALGTLEGKPDASAYAILKESVQILNALDYGDQGGGKKAAERAMEWWSKNFNDRCDRWPTPKGKDPGEAYAMGIDLDEWIRAGLPPVLTIQNERKEQDVLTPCFRQTQSDDLGENKPPEGISPLLTELWILLRRNPGVKIINAPPPNFRFTILRNGKFVGGRINELVFRHSEITEYILNHPDAEIGWKNLIKSEIL